MSDIIYINVEYVGRTKLKHSTKLWDFKYIVVYGHGDESAAVIDADSISEAVDKIASKLAISPEPIVIESPTLAYYHVLCGKSNIDDTEHWQKIINIANNQIERLKEREKD